MCKLTQYTIRNSQEQYERRWAFNDNITNIRRGNERQINGLSRKINQNYGIKIYEVTNARMYS